MTKCLVRPALRYVIPPALAINRLVRWLRDRAPANAAI